MKKKIEDFTVKEIRSICDKHITCKGCPFHFFDDAERGNACMLEDASSNPDFASIEVEVEEDEKAERTY